MGLLAILGAQKSLRSLVPELARACRSPSFGGKPMRRPVLRRSTSSLRPGGHDVMDRGVAAAGRGAKVADLRMFFTMAKHVMSQLQRERDQNACRRTAFLCRSFRRLFIFLSSCRRHEPRSFLGGEVAPGSPCAGSRMRQIFCAGNKRYARRGERRSEVDCRAVNCRCPSGDQRADSAHF